MGLHFTISGLGLAVAVTGHWSAWIHGAHVLFAHLLNALSYPIVADIHYLISVGLIHPEASQFGNASKVVSVESVSSGEQNSVPGISLEEPVTLEGSVSPDSLQSNETYPTILGFDSPAYEVYLENQITISFTCQTTETFGNYTLSCSDPNAVTIGEIRETIRSSVSGPATYIVSADIVALNAGEYTITAEVEINGMADCSSSQTIKAHSSSHNRLL